ncbi:alcohol dehydrogenase catalytic domain-containing protein [Halegenticoccus soli]|uniref:alcohol dehydrogenase catalytic domain-containing protein n=1 Tax=Halegenticoccus soli TaxID=1985678 RepID=UPI000C6E0366|nr:alcohol dehydrogenase catalytic domain-containing protein [Halegenticoccus soli]
MQAIALFPDDSEVRVVEKDDPVPDDSEVLVRTLAVGIDGSDRRIAADEIGGDSPAGENHLVMGHEAVGVVEDANGTALEEGQTVIPLVRRPLDGQSSDELDMAPPGTFHECGIVGAHGYLSEVFTCRPEFLVPVPDSLTDYGFFVEPASLVEKALEQAFTARAAFDWQPQSAFVLGNGNLGLLGLARLAAGDEFARTYCLGRRDRPDPTIDFIERVDGTYIDSRKTSLEAFPEVHEPTDFVFETTGYARHAIDAVDALAPNGVATLQGIPTSGTFEVDAAAFHAGLVTANKALLGVVNSRRAHFEAAAAWLDETPNELLDDLVTGVYGIGEIDEALADSDETIKTVVSFER